MIKRCERQIEHVSLLPGKQPKGSFSIEHYSARLAFHLRKDSRKRCCFELICPGKRTYEVGTGGKNGPSVLVDHWAQKHAVSGLGAEVQAGPAPSGRLRISNPRGKTNRKPRQEVPMLLLLGRSSQHGLSLGTGVILGSLCTCGAQGLSENMG